MDKSADYIIRETKNYGQFVKLLGNREVAPQRLSAIKESILRIGYQPSPILVNEKKEVIDGQGRLAACEALSLPIFYIEKPGLNINDCISMNIKMKNWTDKDYIKCYAKRGKEAYLNLEEMLREFPLLNWAQIMVIVGRANGSSAAEALRNGTLDFDKFTYAQYERARWVSAMIPAIKKSTLSNNRAIETLIRLDRYNLIDKKRMLDSIEKYSGAQEFSGSRASDTLNSLNDIYNYNRRQKKYFADEYRRIADAKRSINQYTSKKGSMLNSKEDIA